MSIQPPDFNFGAHTASLDRLLASFKGAATREKQKKTQTRARILRSQY
jgi:sterol desaturase/sphingolipid hydroxylase (fatty acid hydroxylase superfamily)